MESHLVWQSDPAIAIYATNPRYGRTAGYAGPWNRQSGEAQEKYIIVDMFAARRAARIRRQWLLGRRANWRTSTAHDLTLR